MGSLQQIPPFIDKTIEFPDGTAYEILKPLTDFRKCHDGRPLEARIVFTCRQTQPEPSPGSSDAEFVMKVKVQAPGNTPDTEPVTGPSTTTAAELKALKKFSVADTSFAPHLVAFKSAVQGANGMFPGGYVNFLVMTSMPGADLLEARFWNLGEEGRAEIKEGFLEALRVIYGLGVEPVDCALRNVLWEKETKRCTIIDFELWREATETFSDEKKELERWGLSRRSPPSDWWREWNMAR